MSKRLPPDNSWAKTKKPTPILADALPYPYLWAWVILGGMASGTLVTALGLAQGLENGRSPFILVILFVGMCNFIRLVVLAIDRIWQFHRKDKPMDLGPLNPADPNTGGDLLPVDDPTSIWHHKYFQPYCICPDCHEEALHWLGEPTVSRGWRNHDVVRTCRSCGKQWGQNLNGTWPAPLQGPMLPIDGEYPIGSEPKDITLPWEQYAQPDKDLILAEAQRPPPDVGHSWSQSDALWYVDQAEA